MRFLNLSIISPFLALTLFFGSQFAYSQNWKDEYPDAKLFPPPNHKVKNELNVQLRSRHMINVLHVNPQIILDSIALDVFFEKIDGISHPRTDVQINKTAIIKFRKGAIWDMQNGLPREPLDFKTRLNSQSFYEDQDVLAWIQYLEVYSYWKKYKKMPIHLIENYMYTSILTNNKNLEYRIDVEFAYDQNNKLVKITNEIVKSTLEE